MTTQLTKQQQNILTLIYKHRFLNRPQIQTLLNHKTHNRINGWLKGLYENKFIERRYSHQFGENTKPAIYSIGPAGIRFLKSQKELPPESLRKLYRETDRSENFIAHCIFVADICVSLVRANACSGETDPRYEYATGMDISSPDDRYHFLADTRPQLVIVKHGKGSRTSCSLVGVIEPTLPPYAVRKRLRAYFELHAKGEWEANIDTPFPNVLLVFPTVVELIRAKRYARKLFEGYQDPDDLAIWLTTVEKLKASGITGRVWESA